ncbi:MAG: PEP-CTERM sorting domain-containing protein [Nitrospirae bacterium]|nr:PEP-CTERM sorting domain-containing protein [Nitrospirota bacterium]
MKSVILILSLALLIFGSVSVADATPVEFKIDGDDPNNTIEYKADELDIDHEIIVADQTFTLEDDETSTVFDHETTFDYGVVNSIGILATQDTYDVTAYLSFIWPEELVVRSDGTVDVKTITVHGKGKMNDSRTEFSINFDPVDMVFDTNGLFTVELSDITTYGVADGGCVYSGGCYYPSGEGTIKATVTLQQSPTAVPEPSTFILFGTILIGALGVKKIKG